MRWIIYYGDGTEYSNQDGSVFDAPARNVQVIAQEDPDTGQTFARSSDYYWWTDAGWHSGDWFGLFDYLVEPGPKKVLFGRTIGNREYEAILQKALNNTYLPPKSAWRPNERRVA
jgi:hypothetical protein